MDEIQKPAHTPVPPVSDVPIVDRLEHPVGERAPINPKERMTILRQLMPEQDADARAHNFTEVNLGMSQKLAMLEAERCLMCKKPTCIDGCPVRVNIPRFIDLMARGDMRAAADSLLDDNALPCVTGRVCPQETQCEGVCLRGKKGDPVAIGYLERFVADWANQHRDGAVAHTPAASGKSPSFTSPVSRWWVTFHVIPSIEEHPLAIDPDAVQR